MNLAPQRCLGFLQIAAQNLNFAAQNLNFAAQNLNFVANRLNLAPQRCLGFLQIAAQGLNLAPQGHLGLLQVIPSRHILADSFGKNIHQSMRLMLVKVGFLLQPQGRLERIESNHLFTPILYTLNTVIAPKTITYRTVFMVQQKTPMSKNKCSFFALSLLTPRFYLRQVGQIALSLERMNQGFGFYRGIERRGGG